MLDQHHLTPAGRADVFGPLQGGERVMWRGCCAVAEYAFDKPASLPRWTLPETTHVLVTDRRVLYADARDDGTVTSGELRWLWPQHLRVQPGARSHDRRAAATQIQLVCGGSDGTYPALVFAGGDLAGVADADRMANAIRQGIARFRVDNADKLALGAGQVRMLSRMLIGPEFVNHQGGAGQTVTILGALQVNRPAPAFPAPVSPAPAAVEQFEGTRLITYRPGMAADADRARSAVRAERATAHDAPGLASRAAHLAARVAGLVNARDEPARDHETHDDAALDRPAQDRPVHDLARDERTDELPDLARFEVPTVNLTSRAEQIRRTAGRMSANSGRTRASGRHAHPSGAGATNG